MPKRCLHKDGSFSGWTIYHFRVTTWWLAEVQLDFERHSGVSSVRSLWSIPYETKRRDRVRDGNDRYWYSFSLRIVLLVCWFRYSSNASSRCRYLVGIRCWKIAWSLPPTMSFEYHLSPYLSPTRHQELGSEIVNQRAQLFNIHSGSIANLNRIQHFRIANLFTLRRIDEALIENRFIFLQQLSITFWFQHLIVMSTDENDRWTWCHCLLNKEREWRMPFDQ